MSDDTTTPRRAPSRRPPTVSTVLGDDTILEMVHDPVAGTTGFVSSPALELTADSDATSPDLDALTPYSADNNLLVHRVVLFPSEATEYGSEATLLADVRAFIHRFVDLPDHFEEIAAHYVLYTWIYDAFQEAPYLRVRGDYGSGKSRFLLTVGSLCYKPIFASGASTTSPIFRILDAFRGTLVIDESDFRLTDEKADIIKILNNGNAVGFPVLRSDATPQKEYNPRAFSVFGPKLIASRNLFDDRALESRCISEEMGAKRPRADIPLNLPASFHDEARDLRNKLLTFRFRNRLTPRDLTAVRDLSLEPRIAQILAPLLATVDDVAVRERLRELGRHLGRNLAADRSLSIEAQLLGVIVECLTGAETPPTVKTLTDRFAERHGVELARPATPRWIGWTLRARLGLSLTRTNAGYILDPASGPRLHALCEKYGLVNVAHVMNTVGATPPGATTPTSAS